MCEVAITFRYRKEASRDFLFTIFYIQCLSFTVMLTFFCLSAEILVTEGKRWERAYDLQYMWPLDNTVDENVCAKNMERIYHGHVVAPIPPDISGDWISSQ